MKEHEKILQMIEAVDPADTATMDEIDARVFCFVEKFKYKKHGRAKQGSFGYCLWVLYSGNWRNIATPLYTRSRDALKAIRPENYAWKIGIKTTGKSFCCWWTGKPKPKELPTEELAELHAIITAIVYERDGE